MGTETKHTAGKMWLKGNRIIFRVTKIRLLGITTRRMGMVIPYMVKETLLMATGIHLKGKKMLSGAVETILGVSEIASRDRIIPYKDATMM